MVKKYQANPKPAKNHTQSAEVNLAQDFQDYSEFLPGINRTESIQRFFGTTVNQLLSSGSTQTVDTFWGRVTGRNYNADNIRFEPEDEPNRLNYQFQPGIVQKTEGNVTETVSYINWLERLASIGADTNNHDRIFSEPGYVLDLPINADMLTNYYNYYWLEGNIPLVAIEPTITDPIDIDDITKVSQYTTPVMADYRDVTLVSGLRVQFVGPYVSSTSGDYEAGAIYSVENVGGVGGIKLVELVDVNGNDRFPILTPYYRDIFQGWDTTDYDTTSWDGPGQFADYDVTTTNTRNDLTLNKTYIVMERWSQDKNPWARTNRWFSLEAIRTAIEFNRLEIGAYTNQRTRAERPIIEFHANMELFNTCKNFADLVDFVITEEQSNLMLDNQAYFMVDPDTAVQNNDTVLVIGGENPVTAGPFASLYTIGGVGSTIVLTPDKTFNSGEYIIQRKGRGRGTVWCYDGSDWRENQGKTERGTPPLFKLYDDEQTYLEDYLDNDFDGDKIFGYEINTAGVFDGNLGFAPSFTFQGSFANYRFEWTLNNNRYSKNVNLDTIEEIRGFYYWRDWVKDEYYNGWSNIRGSQRVPVIQTQIYDGNGVVEFDLGTEKLEHPTEYTVSLVNGKYRWYSHSYADRVAIGDKNSEFVWKYDTEYTIHDLISNAANKLEFVDPFGNTDSNVNVNVISDVLLTINIDSDYQYDIVRYRDLSDSDNFGEIHLSNVNQKRIVVSKNSQRLNEDTDYTISGTKLTIMVDYEENDVFELQYVADVDLENAVYDVAPVHFYNSENRPFTGIGYDDLIIHLRRQMSAMPGFSGDVADQNNYHKILRQHTHEGLIRQQIYRTSHLQYLMDQEDINPIKALKTVAQDYTDFKTYFANKVRQLWETETWTSIRELVDQAITEINVGKGESFKYAHSDMAYFNKFKSKLYVIRRPETNFKLPRIINHYGDTKNHVQIWLRDYDATANKYLERPLIEDVDYIIEGMNIILKVPVRLRPEDVVHTSIPVEHNSEQVVRSLIGVNDPVNFANLIVRWYDYRNLSHIPYSATKLGFFRPTQVEIVNGELIGHDGSRHKLSSGNITDIQESNFDVVSAALMDFEIRVFNNLVDHHYVDDEIPATMEDFYPNANGTFAYDLTDVNMRLDDWYNRYALRTGIDIDEIDITDYVGTNEFTWNYSSIVPGAGSWRGLYTYYFGTDRPHTHPWEMLGHGLKPSWWDDHYSWSAGPKRVALLNALAYGVTGNRFTHDYVDIRYARSAYDWFNNTLVTDDGSDTLNPPLTAGVVASIANVDAARDFVFGEWSEIENRWRTSSEYRFALAEALLQLKPYRVYETFWSLNRWRINRNVTQEQWVNPDTCLRQDNNEIHNQLITGGIVASIKVLNPGTGYTFLDLDFVQNVECSENVVATAYVENNGIEAVAIENPGRGLNRDPEFTSNANINANDDAEFEFNVDKNFIVTHLGFNTISAEEFRNNTEHTNVLAEKLKDLKFEYCLHVGGYTDKRIISLELSNDYDDGQIHIPENSYNILIDRNAPKRKVFYSGIRIKKIEGLGYQVDGYNLDRRYFLAAVPSTGGNKTNVQIANVEVVSYQNWRNEIAKVPYDTIFRKRQELFQFIQGVAKYYEDLGFAQTNDWDLDARAAILWSLSDEQDDLFINGINNNSLTFEQGARGFVQTVDINYDGEINILNEQFQPIRRNELLVLRNQENTEIVPKNTNTRIYGIGLSIIEFEHIITMDNITTFNDPIYQPELGIGQSSVRLVGERTRNWNGRVEAVGYLVNDTGLVANFETSVREIESDWISSDSKALERLTRQTIGYNVGYSKPTYMTNTFITDLAAYQFEKGERKYKGTTESIAAMTRNKNIFGKEFDYEMYEEWMVRLGDYGDKTEREPLKFALDRNKIKSNPQHFRFNKNFKSDRLDDRITDINYLGSDAINGNYDRPFRKFNYFNTNVTQIDEIAEFQTFTRNAGLPLTTEIDHFVLNVTDIDQLYDPTAEYALIPNWNRLTGYTQGDRVRYRGRTYQLAVGSTGFRRVSNDVAARGTQISPFVPNGETLIINGETIVFDVSDETTTTFDPIQIDGSQLSPVVPSGQSITLDGTEITFTKTQDTTVNDNIIINGSVLNPIIENDFDKELTIFYSDSLTGPMNEVTVRFNETDRVIPMQQAWIDAFFRSGISSPTSTALDKIQLLRELQIAYTSVNSTPTWETFITNYFSVAEIPDRFINPLFLGDQIRNNPGAAWLPMARDLIEHDLGIITDVVGSSPDNETLSSIESDNLNNAAKLENDLNTVNALFDLGFNSNTENQNLKDLIDFFKANGDVLINANFMVPVTNAQLSYVTDDLESIKEKIDAALLANSAPGNITTSINQGFLSIARFDNTTGARLGVSENADLGFDINDRERVSQEITDTNATNLDLSEIVFTINNAGVPGVSASETGNNTIRISSQNQQLEIGQSVINSVLGINAGIYQRDSTTSANPETSSDINQVVLQIERARIPGLTATSENGVLILQLDGDSMTIGPGTANQTLGLAEETITSEGTTVSNFFNPEEWNIIEDPLNLNIWSVNNTEFDNTYSTFTNGRYEVYQTLDFGFGVEEICAGLESGDDALIKLEQAADNDIEIHNLEVGDLVFIINSSCTPSVDGIHRVTRVDDQRNFYIDRYVERKGFTGKVFPIRSVRFANTLQAISAIQSPKYYNLLPIDDETPYADGLRLANGLRPGTLIYVDDYVADPQETTRGEGYGAVYRFVLDDENQPQLELVRLQERLTDNRQIKNGVLHDNASGDTVVTFEVYDPLKGIIPGIADREIDVKSENDIAYYNNTTDADYQVNMSNFWGQDQVGTVWWDMSTAIYLNYDQGPAEYRQAHWGQLFPGSQVNIYEWTKSTVTPDEHATAVTAQTTIDGVQLTGEPYVFVDQFGDVQYYWSEEDEINPLTGQVETFYYYWVRGKTTTPTVDRDYSVRQLEQILLDTTGEQVDWIAATSENTMLVSSLDTTNRYPELVMTVNFDVNDSDYHQEKVLLAEHDPNTVISEWLHLSLRDSLAGFTQATEIYPYYIWKIDLIYLPNQVVKSPTGKFYRCHKITINVDPDIDLDQDFWEPLQLVEDNVDTVIKKEDMLTFDELLEILFNSPLIVGIWDDEKWDSDRWDITSRFINTAPYDGYAEIARTKNIPDLRLHPYNRQGLQKRPRQTWFVTLFLAQKAMVEKINSQLLEINLLTSDIPWRESFERTIDIGNGLTYDLTEYWDYADWSIPGYTYDRSVGNFFVERIEHLANLTPSEGNIAHVETTESKTDDHERRQVYQFIDGEWVLIYHENATIQFNDLLWDSTISKFGWDIPPWDTTGWDLNANGVFVEIFDEFYRNLWTGDRSSLYTDLWFHAVKHVIREQKEPDWVFKSSYFTVKVRDEMVKRYNKYFTERPEDFIEYIDTVKPFRSKLRDVTLEKTATENVSLDAKDTFLMRIQTNPLLVESEIEQRVVGQQIVDPFTRSYRVTVGQNPNNYSSQIIEDQKVLLGLDIGPDSTIVPILNLTGTGELPNPAVTGQTEAIWINGERIEYGNLGQINTDGIGSGFTSGFNEGFGGVTLLTNVVRGTWGTFPREHSYGDIVEGEATTDILNQNLKLSDWGDNLQPAWNELGFGLHDKDNPDPNSQIIRGSFIDILGISQSNPTIVTVADTSMFEDEMIIGIQGVEGMTEINDQEYEITVIDATTISLNVDSTGFSTYTGSGTIDNGDRFGLIEPWGTLFLYQVLTLQQSLDAIRLFQEELSELIEVFWAQNEPWLSADLDLITADNVKRSADEGI